MAGNHQKACDLILNLDVWKLVPSGETVKAMLKEKIQVQKVLCAGSITLRSYSGIKTFAGRGFAHVHVDVQQPLRSNESEVAVRHVWHGKEQGDSLLVAV